MLKRRLFLSLFVLSVLNAPVHAANLNYSVQKLKQDAYSTITDAVLDEKIHNNLKSDIFKSFKEYTVSEKEKNLDLLEKFYKDLNESILNSDLNQHANPNPISSRGQLVSISPDDANLITFLRKSLQSKNAQIIHSSLYIISKSSIKQLLPEVETLLDTINQDNLDLKSAIVETIGEIGNDSSLDLLTALLNDEDLNIRLKAVQAIGDINTPKSRQILSDNLRNPVLEVALLSAGILAKYDNDQAMNLLQEGIKSPHLSTNIKTVIALLDNNNPKILDVAQKAILLNNNIINNYLLTILSEINTEESAKLIEQILKKSDLKVKSMIALSNLGTDATFNIFKESITSDNTDIKNYALAVISKLNDPCFVPILTLALRDENETVRVTAAKLLFKYNDTSGLNVLREAVNSDNATVAIDAISFLGYAGYKDVMGKLRQLSANTKLPSWKRLDIAIILENLGDISAIKELDYLLSQQRPSTLPREISPSTNALLQLLQSEYSWTRLNACVYLANNKNLKCLPELKKLATNDDLKIKTFALMQLGKYDSPEAIDILKEHLDDDAVRARVTAAESLIKILTSNAQTQKSLAETY